MSQKRFLTLLSTFYLLSIVGVTNASQDTDKDSCDSLAAALGYGENCSWKSVSGCDSKYGQCEDGDGNKKWILCPEEGGVQSFDDKAEAKAAAEESCSSSKDRDRDGDDDDDDDADARDRDRGGDIDDDCATWRDNYKRAKSGQKQSGSADDWKQLWDDNCRDRYGDIDDADYDDDDGGGSGSSSGGGGGISLDLDTYGDVDADYVRVRTEPDCYNCTIYRGYQESKASGTADIITAIGYGLGQLAGPAAQVWSNSIWAGAYEDVNSQWALTARRAQNLCTQRYDNYLGHIDAYGGSPVEADDAIALSRTCNGAPTYAYAGMGGMSGMGMYGGVGNPWMSAGYSPGFMSGMMGPYGMSGGINMGMSYPGYGYGYPSGGVGFGMSGYLGAGGYPPYLGGTWGMGGYMGAGGYGSGYGTGYGTYPYGGAGFSGGITMGLGAGAGYGYNPYYSGGMMGGYGTGAGVMPYGWPTSSYWNNSGGWGDAYSSWQSQYEAQMAYQQQMAAVGARTSYDMYGNYYGNMALQQGAYNTMSGYGYGSSSGYGGYYGSSYGSPYYSPYGGSGYGMGGISASFGFGF